MLFPSNNCQRSTDPTHVSWSNGRLEPATFPRVTSIRIVSEQLPWTIEIVARNRRVGVTCGEVIDYISRNLYNFTAAHDYDVLPSAKKRIIVEAYRHNRSRADGVPGGSLNEGMRRLDFLERRTMFGGLCSNDRLVRAVCGDVLPCTFQMMCMQRYPMTEAEARAQRQRQRRRTSQRPTVETVTDEDEDDNDESDAH